MCGLRSTLVVENRDSLCAVSNAPCHYVSSDVYCSLYTQLPTAVLDLNTQYRQGEIRCTTRNHPVYLLN
jgi:hypothetical protein